MELKPIGTISSPYKRRSQAPFQGIANENESVIEIFDEFVPGLKNIEHYSHLYVLYYAHESKGYHLQTTTPWDTNLHGLFTTRSPYRPNPILVCVVELTKVDRNKLTVKYLDAIDGSPVIDIKPYFTFLDVKNNVKDGLIGKKLRFKKKE
ncbi:MAG: tRNA (N6-threonylcarbamoyladenosine(37)-N6)-methyltransferase TrmO [Promethearchaeota archaeon]|nr:MAG: tRNA (N6-threonylcarbamoyladenosine(37)-N6)-methyltransferase TrmO [Candidatus Lokiarchaeota archaeon]